MYIYIYTYTYNFTLIIIKSFPNKSGSYDRLFLELYVSKITL